jgi:predicted AlkP superfamily pyrophosphatase or phosphodiesterase
MRRNRLLVVQAAGLGCDFARRHGFEEMRFNSVPSIFPALTCTAQATFRTAAPPAEHGLVGNGLYDRTLRRTAFWEQSSALVRGPRIWDAFRARGGTVGLLFWQQSLGESADVVLSPAPIHKHHGGMVEDIYAKPAGLHDRLCRAVGRPFRLARYWGPLASARSSQWIAEATAALLQMPDAAPELCLTYLPALDYDLQRHGPDSPAAAAAAAALRGQLGLLADAAAAAGYALLVYGDYAIGACDRGAVFPNRALAEAGLFAVRQVGGCLYQNFHESRAFALCDHEIAQVYVRRPADVPAVRERLAALPGVAEILDAEEQTRAGVRHADAAELLLVAGEGCWFAYPWWRNRADAPDYARHVDIHSKPGYDPCELFFGWPPGSVSLDPLRVRGSHGRVGPGRETVWACEAFEKSEIGSLADLANRVRTWLDNA